PRPRSATRVPYTTLFRSPCRADDPSRRASATDPDTWASLDAALTPWCRAEADGIGFVFSADDPFAGIDLDDCCIDGELHADASADRKSTRLNSSHRTISY